MKINAKDKLLYMFIEAGEMADIIKKQGDEINHARICRLENILLKKCVIH